VSQPIKGTVSYAQLLRKGFIGSAKLAALLLEELPYVWRDAYMEMTSRQTNIVRWLYGTFEYFFDDRASWKRLEWCPMIRMSRRDSSPRLDVLSREKRRARIGPCNERNGD
jgi:hypothetical protein